MSFRQSKHGLGSGWGNNGDSRGGPFIYKGYHYPSQKEADAAEAEDDAAAKKEQEKMVTVCDGLTCISITLAALIAAVTAAGYTIMSKGGKNKTKRKKTKRKRRRITSSRRSYP